MQRALVTGGSGFLGEVLLRRLLQEGVECTSIDLQPNPLVHARLTSIQGDIRDAEAMETVFQRGPFDAVYHCAAILAHGSVDPAFLWSSNVDGTRMVAEFAKRHGVPRVVFTSSNCLWAENMHRPVREDDAPNPAELYGRSKWEGEKVLNEYRDAFAPIIIRCPTIIDEGRLGLLAILFQFIDEGRRVWTVGGGTNRYQFIYAKDLVAAFLLAADHQRGETLNIGSDDVQPLRAVYQYVIDQAGSRSRVASLPKTPTLLAMRLAHVLRVSPLGPYHYKMIAEDFTFDTSRIKATLGWRPTLTNGEMLYRAYQYYHIHASEIRQRVNVSAHKQAAKMGVISLLKWIS